MMRHPIIGLNMSMDLIDKYEKFDFLVPVSYVDAVAMAGGIPLCVPPYGDMAMFQQILPFLDGFVFIGGDDYRPDHYGGHPQPDEELMPERRDRFDLALAKWILEETSLPVLGVCGGHQLISIAQGGVLIQDIRTEWKTPGNEQPLAHSGRERNDEEKGHFLHPVSREEGS
ncbi:MAG: gamma-glutamyl-gamma-aminobutyrate hydrolase family protein, partial [Deltaproteobacteria bacterium]|nr:gamma-glutamyl-gamma-aminobutyrate hydrolase family protein [Deltaproteobacteria bacterium]